MSTDSDSGAKSTSNSDADRGSDPQPKSGLDALSNRVTRTFPKAVLFDHDGVLVSSEALHHQAWEFLLRTELGLDITTLEFHRVVGRTAIQILRHLLDTHRPGWSEKEYPLEALALKKNDHYLSIAKQGLAVYPGVIDGLRMLRSKGIPCAVVSNAKRREIDYSVHSLGLAPYFDVLLSRDDVPYPKPHPSAFAAGAEALGRLPAECVAIDDSPTGLQSSLLAGIPSVAVLTNYPRESLETPVPGRSDLRPIYFAHSMHDFFAWIERGARAT